MSMAYEEYMKQIVKPMREELTTAGFAELRTPEEVDNYMKETSGTTLVFVNSVCGCAAGLARPAAVKALQEGPTPDHLVTVFAGQDREATAQMRQYFDGYEPSSPSMALLKGKEVIHFIPREDIEDEDIETIVDNLKQAFSQYC
ncbi:BrxA/BrxB family bacilliredoxin [Pullulanibacillus sp. KACC 23026]|uniref:BrxA/BrxB family bacilliredoxin n=1 Tax=Pullulanibacillus sp. KACC 23026 TaxID=3028315 RepID=UPI0023AF94C7|nr:BrxA/BrxB family bacilliredoxin [Pullulanibacillus sp. KACC 23026]WEG10867.1 BrxA/BrxB family bacilliredoxin [Pullulanibacillus sp. KACC 23026]